MLQRQAGEVSLKAMYCSHEPQEMSYQVTLQQDDVILMVIYCCQLHAMSSQLSTPVTRTWRQPHDFVLMSAATGDVSQLNIQDPGSKVTLQTNSGAGQDKQRRVLAIQFQTQTNTTTLQYNINTTTLQYNINTIPNNQRHSYPLSSIYSKQNHIQLVVVNIIKDNTHQSSDNSPKHPHDNPPDMKPSW